MTKSKMQSLIFLVGMIFIFGCKNTQITQTPTDEVAQYISMLESAEKFKIEKNESTTSEEEHYKVYLFDANKNNWKKVAHVLDQQLSFVFHASSDKWNSANGPQMISVSGFEKLIADLEKEDSFFDNIVDLFKSSPKLTITTKDGNISGYLQASIKENDLTELQQLELIFQNSSKKEVGKLAYYVKQSGQFDGGIASLSKDSSGQSIYMEEFQIIEGVENNKKVFLMDKAKLEAHKISVREAIMMVISFDVVRPSFNNL